MTETQPMAAPQIIAGPPSFVTLSNIRTIPRANGFALTFDTDQPVLMAMDFWSHNDPALPNAGSVLEGVLTTHHTIDTGTLPAGNHGGYYLGYSLRLDANDVSGKTLRSQQGMVKILGARTTTNGKAVPVRWNMFGGTPPPNGQGGNWSTYTWAQYSPSGKAYPQP